MPTPKGNGFPEAKFITEALSLQKSLVKPAEIQWSPPAQASKYNSCTFQITLIPIVIDAAHDNLGRIRWRNFGRVQST
jgi:hypothetical protein